MHLDDKMVSTQGPSWLTDLCQSRDEPRTTLRSKTFIIGELKRLDSVIPTAWSLTEEDKQKILEAGNKVYALIIVSEDSSHNELNELKIQITNIYKLLRISSDAVTKKDFAYMTKGQTSSTQIPNSVASSNEVVHEVKPRLQNGSPKSSRNSQVRRLKLSAKYSDLIDKKSGISIRDRYGFAQTSFIDDWLKIRPEGGRVFVDVDGNAWITMTEGLVLLGNVSHLDLENLDG